MFFQDMNLISFQLVAETLFAAFLFSKPVFEPRKHFGSLFFSSSLLMLLCGYFFPVLYFQEAGFTFLYWFFMYSVLLLFPILPLMLSYHMTFYNALLISLASYLVHHVSNIFSSLLNEPLSLYLNLNSYVLIVLKWIINTGSLAFTYSLFFCYYYRQRKENLQLVFDNRQLTFFALVVLIFTILISGGIRIFFYWQDQKALYLIGLLSNFASCLLLFIFFFNFLHHNKLQQELDIEKRLFEESKKQYELSKENIDSLNIKFHDLKYRVLMLAKNENGIQKEDLKDIYDGLGIYEAVSKTGNKALDIVLTQYALRAENNHIKFTSVCDGNLISFMSDYDIFALFGNAITNAIEATSLLQMEEKRLISLIMKKKGNILYISIENFFDEGTIHQKGSHLESSKKDKENHGFGMKSMENIVSKYHGSLHFKVDKDIFRLMMTFVL